MAVVSETRDRTASTPVRPRQPVRAEPRGGWLSWTAAIGIVLLVVARSPTENMPVWTPKAAVALVLTGLAIPQLVVLLRTAGPLRWTAVAATVFLGVTAVAAALSPLVGVGFLGQYAASTGVGWIFYLCLVAVWSLGATVDETGTQLVHDAIVVACVLDSIASILGLVTEHQTGFGELLGHVPGLVTASGQSLGLMDNSVFSGALLAGGFALLATTDSYRPRTRVELLLLLAVGLELSGSRFGMLVALGVAVGVAAVTVVKRRDRWTDGIRPAAAWIAGIGVGYLVNRLLGGTNVGARISSAEGGSTYSARLQEWVAALHATAHHPVFGVGPAQSMSGVSKFWPQSFAVDSAPFEDAHNFFIEILVTTGIVGLGCFLLWLIPVLRHARGPLLACGLGILAVELVEPLYIGVTPIAFLALGAAIRWPGRPVLTPRSTADGGPADTTDVTASTGGDGAVTDALPVDPGEEDDPGRDKEMSQTSGDTAVPSGARSTPTTVTADRSVVLLRIVTTTVAVLAAVVLLIGDAAYRQGMTGSSGQVARLKTAVRLLPPWPYVAVDVAVALTSPTDNGASSATQATKDAAVVWAQKAVDRNPTDFELLTELAGFQQAAGDLTGARANYLKALSYFPWYQQALGGLASLDLQEGDATAALALYREAQANGGNGVDRYQAQCLSHVIPRHLSTTHLLLICPVKPPLLPLLGVQPPLWEATSSSAASGSDTLTFPHL